MMLAQMEMGPVVWPVSPVWILAIVAFFGMLMLKVRAALGEQAYGPRRPKRRR